jgi:hypothetical protein
MRKASNPSLLTIRKGPIPSLAAPDCDDDFQLVAVGKPRVREAAARHDFAVLFHRHAFPRELERLEQPHDALAGLDALDLAVDRELDHL